MSEPWASWFEYAQPSIPVFTDPRIEIFPATVWDDYSEIRVGGSRWQSILDRWQADTTGPAIYEAGSQGPPEADQLLAVRGRRWRQI